MRKLKLHPEMLAVESFAPVDTPHAATGTVRGHSYPTDIPCNVDGPTYNCQETGPGVPTCNDSCYDLCPALTYAPGTCID